MRLTPMQKFLRAIMYLFLLQSCTQKEIQFGDNPENSYTNIAYTDTVEVELSTVLADSFATNNPGAFLVGRYLDPQLGVVSTRAFSQLTVPTTIPVIPSTAKYDSLSFVFHPDNYYYGDTSSAQTFIVNELIEPITPGYNNSLYNTSNFRSKPIPLGMKKLFIRPGSNDSVVIRLSDMKGEELFARLRNQSTDIANAEQFLQYFKGVSISIADHDTTAVYRLKIGVGKMFMRLHYHTNTPYHKSEYVDFPALSNEFAFNQVLVNRLGIVAGNGVREIPSSQTNQQSFLQPGTAMYLKILFPSLRTIMLTDKVIKLLKAELVIRPAQLTFDRNKFLLPSPIYLATTDASNIIGDEVVNETGKDIQFVSPVLDDLYGENNYYRFNITRYVSDWLKTPGTEDNGFFVMHNASGAATNVTRLIANNSKHGKLSSKLLLSFIVINK